MAEENPASEVLYEDLAALEQDFDDADTEILRYQYSIQKDLYAKRKALVESIADFWPLVLEQGPDEVSRYIQHSDSKILAKCLKSVNVTRFELDDQIKPESQIPASAAEPRSVAITFEFSENPWFENRVLEKKFWFRRALDGWTGLVSEPVVIDWKSGMDPTKGLTKAVRALWDARVAAGDMRKRTLAEFDALSKLVETHNVSNTSFFTWFAHISSRRWVGAEESREAWAVERERRERFKAGREVEPVDSPESDQLEQQVEVDEEGEDLATTLVNDLWPGALKYFIAAQEADDLADDEDLEESSESDGDEGCGCSHDHDHPKLGSVQALLGEVNGSKQTADDRPAKKQRKL